MPAAPIDSLDQHRRELDATLAALQAVRDHAYAEHATIVRQEAELVALRADLVALSNRVESLTRAVGADPRGEPDPLGYIELGDDNCCRHRVPKGLGCRVCDPAYNYRKVTT